MKYSPITHFSFSVLSERLFIMNLMFIPVVVALTGLFGLAFALFCAFTCKRGGKPGKPQPRQPTGRSSSTKKDFHRCSTPGCKFGIPGQDPHSHCFTCLTLDNDMNICGPCLTSPPDFQQCRAIRLFLWNCEARSLSLPVSAAQCVHWQRVSWDLCSSWAPLSLLVVC